jgi:hypothetical protein
MKQPPKLGYVLLLLVAGVFVATQGRDFAREPAGTVLADLAAVSALAGGSERRGDGRIARRAALSGSTRTPIPATPPCGAWRPPRRAVRVGRLLPARRPCHKGTTLERQSASASSTWDGALAVIYVGQQAWDQLGHPVVAPTRQGRRADARVRARVASRGTAAPRPQGGRGAHEQGRAHEQVARAARRPVGRRSVRTVAVRPSAVPRAVGPSTCAGRLLSASRGRLEADDAIAKTQAEGFAHGSVIFLDIERMERTPQAMRDYYRQWTAPRARGRALPAGYYAHKHNAALIYADVKAVYAAAGGRASRRSGSPAGATSTRTVTRTRWGTTSPASGRACWTSSRSGTA